jgi:hypothetical protein
LTLDYGLLTWTPRSEAEEIDYQLL